MAITTPLEQYVALLIPFQSCRLPAVDRIQVILLITIHRGDEFPIGREKRSFQAFRRDGLRQATIEVLDPPARPVVRRGSGEKKSFSARRPGGPLREFANDATRQRFRFTQSSGQENQLRRSGMLECQYQLSVG